MDYVKKNPYLMLKSAVCQYHRFGSTMGLAHDCSQPGRVDSSLNPCMSNPGKWLWFAHIGSHMKQQISGLHKSSSWALIPVVLLNTPGGLMLSLLACLWTYTAGRKKRLSLRHCVLYPTHVFTARFKISHTWFAFCQISFMWVEGKKTINLIYAHSQPL